MGGSTNMMQILKKPLAFNLIYQGTLLFTIGQQIYYPQTYQYMHLVMLVIRLIVSEMYESNHRAMSVDKLLLPLILSSSFVSVVEKVANLNLSLVYLALLLLIMICMVIVMKTAIKDSKENLKFKMHPKHMEIYKKNKQFLLGILYSIYCLTVLGCLLAIYEITLLFFKM